MPKRGLRQSGGRRSLRPRSVRGPAGADYDRAVHGSTYGHTVEPPPAAVMAAPPPAPSKAELEAAAHIAAELSDAPPQPSAAASAEPDAQSAASPDESGAHELEDRLLMEFFSAPPPAPELPAEEEDDDIPALHMSRASKRAMWATIAIFAVSVVAIGSYTAYEQLVVPAPVELSGTGPLSALQPLAASAAPLTAATETSVSAVRAAEPAGESRRYLLTTGAARTAEGLILDVPAESQHGAVPAAAAQPNVPGAPTTPPGNAMAPGASSAQLNLPSTAVVVPGAQTALGNAAVPGAASTQPNVPTRGVVVPSASTGPGSAMVPGASSAKPSVPTTGVVVPGAPTAPGNAVVPGASSAPPSAARPAVTQPISAALSNAVPAGVAQPIVMASGSVAQPPPAAHGVAEQSLAAAPARQLPATGVGQGAGLGDKPAAVLGAAVQPAVAAQLGAAARSAEDDRPSPPPAAMDAPAPTFDELLAAAQDLARHDRHDPALEAYQRALQLRPDSSPAMSGLAFTQLNLGDPTSAKSFASRAVADDPTNAEGWIVLGAAEDALGSRDAARDAYRHCAEQGAGNYVAECKRLIR
jgi:hypothetical protein